MLVEHVESCKHLLRQSSGVYSKKPNAKLIKLTSLSCCKYEKLCLKQRNLKGRKIPSTHKTVPRCLSTTDLSKLINRNTRADLGSHNFYLQV